jgi:hypothetical protein
MVQFMRILFFYCTKKMIPGGKIGFGHLPFSASECTRTKCISFPDTDFVPKTGNLHVISNGWKAKPGIV